MDYLHLDPSVAGYSNLLTPSDKLSGFSILFPAESECAENASEAICD